MSYFHTTAVFEARATSLDDADRTAASLFKSFRHSRVHYYEHDVSTGSGPYSPSKNLYFSVIAEFDVEAGTEEKAVDVAEEALDALATDDVQFIAFGLTPGERRARPTARPVQEEESEAGQEARAESGEAEDRRGKRRGSRSRGRKRKGERGTESAPEEFTEAAPPATEAPSETVYEAAEEGPVREGRATVVEPAAQAVTVAGVAELPPQPAPEPSVRDEPPPPPPPRSSAAMRVKLAMSFRASELDLQRNGAEALDQEEFLARAIATARTRHPELPTEVEPTHEIVVQPWGETVLTLTWEYDVPVPSASEEA
jgi:hypothetical protein